MSLRKTLQVSLSMIIPRNLNGRQYYFHKIGIRLPTCSERNINTRKSFVYYTNGNEMNQMVRIEITCNCIPISRIAFCTHAFNLNYFLDDFNCVL